MPHHAFRIEPFDVQSAPDDLWKQYFALSDALHWENVSDPDDAPLAHALQKKLMRDPGPYRQTHRWMVLDAARTQMLGVAQLSFATEASPDHEQNRHVASGSVGVHPDHRRRGLGAALLRAVLACAREHGKTVLQGGAQHESGLAVCRHLGGRVAIEAAENRLKLADVDWAMIEAWAAEGPRRAPGVALERFSDVPEADIAAYTELYTETMNQQPMGELEGLHVTTPASRRTQEAELRAKGIAWTTLVTREPDGAISGLTEVAHSPEDPQRAFQMLTGVRDAYRGRGLGKWLKAAMLLHLRSACPAVKFVTTGNADSNAPMLSINERMGFKRHLGHTAFKFQLDELQQRLGRT